MSTFITAVTVNGDQAIFALDQMVSAVENTADEESTTVMVRLRDQTHLELSMTLDKLWKLIPG